MKKQFIFLLSLAALLASILAQAIQPLPMDQAFAFNATAKDNQTIILQWNIAPGYYLYRDHFNISTTNSHNTTLAEPILPRDYVEKTIPSLGQFAVYNHSMYIIQPVIASTDKNITLTIHYQGCSEQGFCYPPVDKIITMDTADNSIMTLSPNDALPAPAPAPNTIETLLSNSNLWKIVLSFFVLGVLISLTPCVLPMIPILSSIIIGQQNKSRQHAFFLSLSYVFGMALTYAIAGIITVLVGLNLQATFQQPWLIILVSFIFIAMALSLFDVYQVQLPLSWRTALARTNDHQKHGSLIGTFFVGVLSTLILSPCVTPPLVVALTYISQTKHIITGGLALFFMGLGQGLPLLLIGIFGAQCLPKAGKWMVIIKKLMGLLMIAMAIWMLSRLWPVALTSPNQQSSPYFIIIKNNQDLTSQLNSETAINKPVLLDFYANWCVSCKEMDIFTFNNPQVQLALKNVVLLRADVTANNADDQALEKQFGVIAPPTIILFDKNHHGIQQAKIIGYMPAKAFLKHLSLYYN